MEKEARYDLLGWLRGRDDMFGLAGCIRACTYPHITSKATCCGRNASAPGTLPIHPVCIAWMHHTRSLTNDFDAQPASRIVGEKPVITDCQPMRPRKWTNQTSTLPSRALVHAAPIPSQLASRVDHDQQQRKGRSVAPRPSPLL